MKYSVVYPDSQEFSQVKGVTTLSNQTSQMPRSSMVYTHIGR